MIRNKEVAAMTQSEPNGVFAMVELNYQGVFNRNHFSYTGGVKTIFNDVDFSSMTYFEFGTFNERFMHEDCKKFYYSEPGNSLMKGLNPISDDVEYVAFIFYAHGTDGIILVYVDRIGVGVDGWIDDEDNDDDEHASCIDGEIITLEKKQKPILRMRFKGTRQVKSMLCNYVVTNEYQLCFEKKNDTKRLLVRCSKGTYTFRLWASWTSDEESFQIKSLKVYHNCARNFDFGSLSQKISVRNLRVNVMIKSGIQVNMGQCRRAKKYALNLVEGSLVEHYGKLWSCGHEILRTNPGSTVILDVEDGPDGKKYFSKFYCCFQGVKQGWIEGCRRIIGLDGCFLKGVCKGELLCAIGKDENDKIYPISWVVVNVENKQNWKWFLELLIDDLNLNLGNGYSLMSDQHKGLIEAVKELFPYIEHRQCARHICQNL
uniref:MULE transposase domain-containing protein n=1 Tax=Lactuca sativa TaxID=4236 RepID=A0A9R1VEB3_LACSA|nr:hypothetical protein LSAT_V11C500266550 [Lactuca sativa]